MGKIRPLLGNKTRALLLFSLEDIRASDPIVSKETT